MLLPRNFYAQHFIIFFAKPQVKFDYFSVVVFFKFQTFKENCPIFIVSFRKSPLFYSQVSKEGATLKQFSQKVRFYLLSRIEKTGMCFKVSELIEKIAQVNEKKIVSHIFVWPGIIGRWRS